MKKVGPDTPAPCAAIDSTKPAALYLIVIAADPGEIMTLATGVRHNVKIATFGWIGVLKDRALTGPDDVEDVGRYVTLSYSALPILVEVQVVLSIDVDVLQLTDLRHVARCAVAHWHFGIVGRIEGSAHPGFYLHVLGHGPCDPVPRQKGVGGFHRDGGSVLRHLVACGELEHCHIGTGYVLEITMGGVTGQAQGVVPIGCVREFIIANFKGSRPCIQGVGIMASIAGELFGFVAVMNGPAYFLKLHGVGAAVGLVGPGVEGPLLPVTLETGRRLV